MRAAEWPTFESLWTAAVAEVGDRPFLIFESTDESVTRINYREMDALVASTAAALAARGLAPGAAVHLVLGNSIGFVATWLACSRLGAWMVPSDPRATSHELAEHAGRVQPAVAVVSSSRADDYRAALDLARVEASPDVVVLDEQDTRLRPLLNVRGTAVAPAGTAAGAAATPDQRLAVMFTSGTTSAPKGVELTQANYGFAGSVMAAAAGLTQFDRQFVVLPLFHANAQYYSFAAAIAAGASVALMQTFSASRYVEQARRHDVTHVSLFAAPMRMILARTPAGTAPLALRHAWFAQNVSSDQFDAIEALLGCRPRQLYGMTETVPAVLTNPPVGSVPTALGRPTLGCHVRVVDDEGSPVEPGAAGRVQVGGIPGRSIFAGYLDAPEVTAESFVEQHPDGFVWFDTGDSAAVDEDGFHHFAGRRTDVLKVAGENVSTVEVEAVLGEHPLVSDVAVVGAPDPIRDEVPIAYLVLAENALPTAVDEVAEWATLHLAPSKRPREFHIVAELPRTSVGKIRKFLLGQG